MRRYAFEALLIHSVWFLFLFGFTDGFATPVMTWLIDFFQWDARWYATIAQDGHGFLPQTYVFPPLYGWILGRLTDLTYLIESLYNPRASWVLNFYPVAAIFGVTMFATANALFVFLTERRWQDPEVPTTFKTRLRLWVIAVSNPVGYFAIAAYSDLFFFALLMLTLTLLMWTSRRRELWRLPLVEAKTRRWLRVALTGLLFALPWTRLTGFAAAIWILLKRKEAVATLVSLCLFLYYYWSRTHDPFFFLFVQTVFDMPEGGFFTGAWKAIRILFHVFTGEIFQGWDFFVYWMNFGLLPIVALGLSGWLAYWLARRREFEWATIVVAITLISHNQAFWRSTVRYALPLFPLFYWMVLAKPRETLSKRIVLGVAIGISLMLQIFYARLFRSGAWAF